MLELPPHPPLDDRAALDAQYNNREMVPEHVELYEKWTPMCAQVLADFPHQLDAAYGTTPREVMDIILPDPAKSGDGPFPVLLYIHGGYWMSRTKGDQTFLARAYADAGIAFALVEYDLMPGVRMVDIVRQCREAVRWMWTNGQAFGIDPKRIFVSGHSAGGHLTAELAATDWSKQGMAPNILKGGVALSGIYDLAAMKGCYLQDTLALTDEEVARHSPQYFETAPATPLIVAPGGAESDAFHHQSRNLVNTWNAKGGNCAYLEPEGCNHFTILADFADPASALCRAAIALVRDGKLPS